MPLTKRKKIGYKIADGVLAAITLFYNADTQNAVLEAVIEKLEKARGMFKPKKAAPEYKEARYGDKA